MAPIVWSPPRDVSGRCRSRWSALRRRLTLGVFRSNCARTAGSSPRATTSPGGQRARRSSAWSSSTARCAGSTASSLNPMASRPAANGISMPTIANHGRRRRRFPSEWSLRLTRSRAASCNVSTAGNIDGRQPPDFHSRSRGRMPSCCSSDSSPSGYRSLGRTKMRCSTGTLICCTPRLHQQSTSACCIRVK